MAVSRKSTCTNDLRAELAVFSMEYHFNLKEQMTDRQTVVIQTWVSGRHFLENA